MKRRALALALALACVAVSCRRGRVGGGSPLDEAKVKAMSHALLDAFDRADEQSFTKMIGPTMTLVYPVRRSDSVQEAHNEIVRRLHGRHQRNEPARTRTYGEEHVTIGPDAAVFLGESVEHFHGDAWGTPPEDNDRWVTLVWVRGPTGWRAAHWQWAKGGVAAQREAWNDAYREQHDFPPSKFLAEIIQGRKPGTALDISMGQGRNTLLLASKGWQVTGFDVSDLGLCLAREAAAKRNLQIDAVEGDDDTFDYGTAKWDLVAMIYAGCDEARLAKLRKALKPGGLAVVEGFHKDTVPSIGFGTGELSALFRDGFTILRDEVVEEVSPWGGTKDPVKVVHFAAVKD